MKKSNDITYDELHKKFIYLAPEGILINIKTRKVVGTPGTHGYLRVGINNKVYLVHRIVYYMYYGYWPENDIDHINKISYDNRICNLREVSRSCNLRNSKLSKNNCTGIKGVSWHKKDTSWAVSIHFKNNRIYIGSFKNFINAVKARYYAEQKFGYTVCDNKSSASAYLNKLKNFAKIEFTTNIKIEKLSGKDTPESEWTFFCYTGKRKIDKLAKK